jgi:hypothetical protein
VVELNPQEDAMLRSVCLLSWDDDNPTYPNLPAHIRLGYEHFLLLASLGTLIASAPFTSGQTNQSSGAGERSDPQAQICDAQKQSDAHTLSLTIAKAQPSDEGMSVVEQQSASQGSSESTSKDVGDVGDVGLPQVQRSSSAKQEPLCKKTESASEPGHPDDPLPQINQTSDPVPVPEVPAVSVPTVSYADGKLTINAQNVRLGDVIEAIRVRVGISVEFPPEAMNDRVFDHVGPAPVRDALTRLLYGSGFNYVIQTSSQDPQIVTKLILSAQSRLATAASPQRAGQPVPEQEVTQALYGGAGFNADTTVEPSQPVPTAMVGIPTGFNVQQAATASGKTPGQILDELQKHQLQVLDDQSPPPQ